MVKEKDAVNHPEHYESGSYECIDEMIAVFGMSVVANFLFVQCLEVQIQSTS